jgi:ATP-dependent Lhr-like helicase
VTNDAFAPLRSPRLTAPGWSQRARTDRAAARRRFGSRRTGSMPQVQGRWSLAERLFAGAGDADPSARRRAQAELLLERHGIVTREHVLAEGVPGGFSSLYDAFAALETIGIARRGYFVEGLGGAQFALPGAVERLRAQRDDDEAPPVVLAATDPAQPYGAALKWPDRGEERAPARQAGAYVVLCGAEPVLYVERGGKGLQVLVAPDDARLGASLEALVDAVHRRRIARLAVERVDGEPVLGSPYEERLVALGFRTGPRKLTLTA